MSTIRRRCDPGPGDDHPALGGRDADRCQCRDHYQHAQTRGWQTPERERALSGQHGRRQVRGGAGNLFRGPQTYGGEVMWKTLPIALLLGGCMTAEELNYFAT